MPDFAPKKNDDGSCHAYRVVADDNCSNLAAEYSLTNKKIEGFNKKTWGWNGCELLYKDTIMCLSEGDPPFPAPIANAVCGPQKPGTKAPTDGRDIADLNHCPLNACCNIWGQCGITDDFCVDTNTGAPGTAKNGTYGCISNCGTDVVKGTGTGDIKVGYFEGYNMGRKCLFQDAAQIDTSAYTHVHFGFATLTADYKVKVGDALSSYQFSEFKRLKGVKRILSFGGWDFSTMPATISIFREGVKPANRLKLAESISRFITDHGLDGVDIDWEYPGAPDIGDPPGQAVEGLNYLKFLTVLKKQLPSKSVSIAAPASYWYLKQYPIKRISRVVDYIIYMTYDLHGQWDANNGYSQVGCDDGNCLRSQVNLTETEQSLAMITKAGVPASKVIVGITSYGRSFNMAQAGCWGPSCTFTGDRLNSDATKGVCTDTAGYISDAEISEIMSNKKRAGRVTTSFVDSSSNSDILVYDNTQWVSYMSARTKKTRTSLYAAWGMGGTTDWATDLQEYHDVPKPAKSWPGFTQKILGGEDPKLDNTRNGNWTDYYCTDFMAEDPLGYTAEEQWSHFQVDDAWKDIIRIWKETDKEKGDKSFSQSVATNLRLAPGEVECRKIEIGSNCQSAINCVNGLDSNKSGPAGKLIWNSFVKINQIHVEYSTSLFKMATVMGPMLSDLENKFAPIPPEVDHTMTLVLIDLLTLGLLSAAGPYFNAIIKRSAYFREKTFKGTVSSADVKDTTMTLIGARTTIAKDLLSIGDGEYKWTPASQDSFSAYIGGIIFAWHNTTSYSLDKLFSGNDTDIETLWTAISHGKFIAGHVDREAPKFEKMSDLELKANILKSTFAMAIPLLWKVSNAHAFVVDSGFGCDEEKPLDKYLTEYAMDATGVCYNGRRYYLAHPNGNQQECECHHGAQGGPCTPRCKDNRFTAAPGVDSLDGSVFGGITKDDLVKGAIRTYLKNGKTNNDKPPDSASSGTIDDLMDVDITTPGYIRIPVCSPERAYQSWGTDGSDSAENFPCNIPPGKDKCGDSTFEDHTTSASPSVDDCRQIIRNIEYDGTTQWTHSVISHPTREILRYGSCAFSIQAAKTNGNDKFYVGGQDVIDLINSSIEKYASNGKVSVKGQMDCDGSSKAQLVTWDIYPV